MVIPVVPEGAQGMPETPEEFVLYLVLVAVLGQCLQSLGVSTGVSKEFPWSEPRLKGVTLCVENK